MFVFLFFSYLLFYYSGDIRDIYSFPSRISSHLTAVVTVKFERQGPQHRKNFFDQLEKENAVSQCYMVAGEVGSVLILNVIDMEEYTELADRLFHADENVSAFTTHLAMSKLK